jgi:ATP-dependent DNA helicase RecG
MANGGGGSVVFGVHDQATGRSKSILGVPNEVDVSRLRQSIYDRTDPHLTPVIEEVLVPEGTGRLLIMQVYPGLPPYTDSSGLAKIRIGTECKPLTGSLRANLMTSTGVYDFTATVVPGPWQALVSATSLEILRALALREKAPKDLTGLSDEDLLRQIGVLGDSGLTVAGLLLGGAEQSIRAHMPNFLWTYLRMESDTRYRDRRDSSASLPAALLELEERIGLDNPITTLEQGLVHAEFRAYPIIALREVLLNALCHADFRLPGPILVKQHPRRLEVSNPGGFVGGITAQNILHHPPVPRNPLLVHALACLRLVNRSNLGISRMYESFLIEGKEPPAIQEQGQTIIVTLLHQEPSRPFRAFVAAEGRRGRIFGVDDLLILNHLTRHSEATTHQLAELCQRGETAVRESLSSLEREDSLLQRGGTGKGTYWSLSQKGSALLLPSGVESSARTGWEIAKSTILAQLQERGAGHQSGLSNTDIRKLTQFDRNQAFRLMRELRNENPSIQMQGHGAGATYFWDPSTS